MGHGYKSGAGGVNPLNFKVIEGTTEPANPKENMIWVNTSNKITGWYFSATQPDNMAEGELWFETGNFSEVSFNALKKNTIQVYPKFVKQWVSGELKDVTAKIYKNGEWKEFFTDLVLFDKGQTVPWITKTPSSGATVTLAENIVFNYTSESGTHSAAGTEESQDLSEYSNLYFDMVVTAHHAGGGGIAVVGVTSNEPAKGANANTFIASINPTVDGVRRTVSVDISNVDDGYIVVHGIIKATIYKVWCERSKEV